MQRTKGRDCQLIAATLNNLERLGNMGTPKKLFMGRSTRGLLPNLQYAVQDVVGNLQRKKATQKKGGCNHTVLLKDDKVIIQDHVPKIWELKGTIEDSRQPFGGEDLIPTH